MFRRLWLSVLVVACLAAAGCPSGCDAAKKLVNPTGTSVESVTVTPLAAQLIVGQTQQFTATVAPSGVPDKSVTWSVAPAAVATIDTKGVLTALAPGQAIVTATSVGTPVHTAQAVANITASSR